MAKNVLTPFQLLELNVISAQDLAQISRKMRTYAVAWMHQDRKLSTRVDMLGHNNPTWNDKFVFRVDDEFLSGDTSAIMIEIYCLHWFRDIHVGTVRVIVGNVIPPIPLHHHKHLQLDMRFVALLVRRPSGRPQGILNIGVAILDSSMRSMPLYNTLSASAVGYRHLMGEEDPHARKDDDKNSDDNSQFLLPWIPKPELRRTKSENSSMIRSIKNGKVASSPISGSELENNNNNNHKKQKSKASSMISGHEIVKKEILKKSGSIYNGSDIGALAKAKYGSDMMDSTPSTRTPKEKSESDIPNAFPKLNRFDGGSPPLYRSYEHGTPKRPKFITGKTDITPSDLGPSASEVAAVVQRVNKHHQRIQETESDIMGAWSLGSSTEGLQSKLERWRAELRPVYDRGEISGFLTSSDSVNGKGTAGQHRRHTYDEEGVFSCFGSVCGLECSIVCGGSSTRKKKDRRPKRAQSLDNFSFL